MDEKLKAMAQTSPFHRLTRRDVVKWARRLDAAHIAVGQSVRISSFRSCWMYLVLDGTGLVTRGGRAHAMLRPGDCEVPSGGPASELVALTGMTVLNIPHWAADELGIEWAVRDEGEVAGGVRWPAGAPGLLPWAEPGVLPEYGDAASGLSYRG